MTPGRTPSNTPDGNPTGSPTSAGRVLRAVLRITVVAALLMAVAAAAPAGAQDATGIATDDQAEELAERHAPVIELKFQEQDCDPNGEQYAPASAEIVLDNDQILLRQVGTGNPVVAIGPSAADIHDRGEGFYLDFPGNALDPECVFEKDFRRYNQDRPAVVYAHIVGQEDRPDRLALQYWFFFYYNDYNNKHEGDWEGIQLLFDVGTVEEALATEPVSVGYFQHFGGELADWDGRKLEQRDGHPVVYTAVGSHASYFGSNLYIGRSGSEGFGCDSTQGPYTTLEPEVVLLPDEVNDPDDPLAWLDFEGRWGERQAGPFDGPTGPITKSRWTEPIDWHDELRSASVVVPGGENSSTPVVNTFCGVVEWGSGQVIVAQENPLRLLATVAGLGLLALWAARRTEWDRVPATPVVRRRRLGEILRAAGRLYRQQPGRFLEIGLLYIPVTVVLSLITLGIDRLSQSESAGNLASVALFVVGLIVALGGALMLQAVTAAVAAVMVGPERGLDLDGLAGYRMMFRRFGWLMGGFVQILLRLGWLVITVVGIPLAIRRLVQYQFFTSVTMIEGLRPSEALARSTELVKGRWFHTAFVAVSLSGIISLSNFLAGVALLLLLAGLPLWLFSLMVSVVSALIAPYSGIGAVLLYGDAAAEHGGQPAEDSSQEPDSRVTV